MRPPDPQNKTAPVSAEAALSQSNQNPPNLSAPALGYKPLELVELITLASAWHFTDVVRQERTRVEALCSPLILNEQLISVAPVLFRPGRRFDVLPEDVLSEGGALPDGDPPDSTSIALVVPCRDQPGELFDVAAFEFGGKQRVATYFGRAIAVGLGAIFEARHYPRFRVRIVANVVDWLKEECSSLLPIDWRETALLLRQRRVGGGEAPRQDSRRIERKLQLPLTVFVRDEEPDA